MVGAGTAAEPVASTCSVGPGPRAGGLEHRKEGFAGLPDVTTLRHTPQA